MRNKTHIVIIFIIIVFAAVSGCAGGAGRAASSWPGLSVDSEIAYLAYNQHIYAINLTNGLERWRFPQEPDNKVAFYATPVLADDGQLLVGDFNNTLHSLNSQSGQENWAFNQATDRYVGSPLVKDGQIFAPNAGHELFALNANGSLLWEFETEGPLWGGPISESECDCIYIPSMDHHLYSVNAQSGIQEWQSEAFGGSIVSAPAISPEGTILYVGTFGNQVLAVDSQNGSIIWETPTNNFVWGGLVLASEQLYVTDLSGMVYSIDANTGGINWQFQADGAITGSPLVTDDTIYVGTEDGNFYAINLNGTLRWTRQFSGRLHTTPVIGGDLILIASIGSDELVFAVDNNGAPVWSFIPVNE